MAIYLKETKLNSGRTIQELVKLPKKTKFWNKEQTDKTNQHYMHYVRNKKNEVIRVVSNSYDGTKTTYKMMQSKNRIGK